MCEKIVEVAVLVDVDAVHLHQKPTKQDLLEQNTTKC